MRRRVWWLPLVAMLEVNMMRAQDLSVGTAQATALATGGHVDVQFTTGAFHGNVEALQRAMNGSSDVVLVKAARCDARATMEAEQAVDVVLRAAAGWRWDATALVMRATDSPCTERGVVLRRQPPKLAAFLEDYQRSQRSSSCADVQVAREPRGTYLGNRFSTMVQVFSRAALQAVAERPFIPRGLPKYLLSDAWCDTRADLECFFLPASPCGLDPGGLTKGPAHEYLGPIRMGGKQPKEGGRCIHDNSSWNCDPSYQPSGIPNFTVPSCYKSQHRLPRYRSVVSSMTWRPGVLAARRSQHGSIVAKK